MKSICLIIISGFILSCQGYTAIFPNSESKEFPGECYDTDTKIHFKPGESRQRTGLCEEMTCGTDFSINYFGCGVVRVDSPDCVEIERDFSQPYPECCRKYKCVIGGETNFI
ncbi:uncharacterized protein LOC115253693 isoform X3 [Aedes albopictus]|uniref:Single domain-containing protein n=1 Tax=Aedes albopictus TaxID=7160 RepID=A0ABM1Y4B5_AEDAL|nr:uncharacterized protein LOC109400458 isoform X3 [Aedes albopictus]